MGSKAPLLSLIGPAQQVLLQLQLVKISRTECTLTVHSADKTVQLDHLSVRVGHNHWSMLVLTQLKSQFIVYVDGVAPMPVSVELPFPAGECRSAGTTRLTIDLLLTYC